MIPKEIITSRIINLRDEKVILDIHLAQLYKVETRVLKQAVNRNIDRFPTDFMFKLNEREMEQVVSQNVTPSKSYFGGAQPYAFTEAGIAMLSSVLRSKEAIQINIMIIKTFIAPRKLASNYNEILNKLNEVEDVLSIHDADIKTLFNSIKDLLDKPKPPRRRIGFKTEN